MTDTLPTPRKSGWPKGVSGNPAGRKPGSKNRLAQILIDDLTQAYTDNAPQLIKRCIEESPLGFLQTLVKLLPRELISSMTINSTSLNLDIGLEQKQKLAESWIMSAESAKEKVLPGVMEIHTKRVADLEKSARKAT